jgi:hypothetical protein
MSSHFSDGLFVGVRRIGHCGHRTSFSLDLHENVAYEREVNKEGNDIIGILMPQDA